MDDAAFVVIGVCSLVLLLYLYRNRRTVNDLKTSLNIFTALMVIGVVVKIIFAPIEAPDIDAFGDEIPSIIIGAMIVVSRFV